MTTITVPDIYCPYLLAIAVCNYLSLQLFVTTHPAITEWITPCLRLCVVLHNFSSHRLLRTPLNHFIKTLNEAMTTDLRNTVIYQSA